MSDPLFLLQIVKAHPPYETVRLPGGGPLERHLVDALTVSVMNAIAALPAQQEAFIDRAVELATQQGIGMMRSEGAVQTAIRRALRDAFQQCHVGLSHTDTALVPVIRQSIVAVLSDLKGDTRAALG